MATVTQTYTFVNGAVPTATQWNSNFVTLFAAFSNIDNTNIGTNGLYASQIKPISTGTATFGGAVGYTFTTALSVLSGYVAPVFSGSTGTTTATTLHDVYAAQVVGISNGASSGSATVTLSGNAAFTGLGNYEVFLTIEGTATCSTSAATVPVIASVTNVSSTQFTIYVYTANGLTNNSGSTQSYVVNWRAVGV